MSDRLDSTGLAHYTGEIIKKVGMFAVDTGTISSLPKVIADARIDGQYVVKNTRVFRDLDLGWVTTDGKLILYGTLEAGDSYPGVQLWLQRVDALEEEEPGCVLTFKSSTGSLGNLLSCAAENLIPGTGYTYTLYKCGDGGNDTEIDSVTNVAAKPEYSYYWSESGDELTAGWYYATVEETVSGTLVATSTAVEFTAGE